MEDETTELKCLFHLINWQVTYSYCHVVCSFHSIVLQDHVLFVDPTVQEFEKQPLKID